MTIQEAFASAEPACTSKVQQKLIAKLTKKFSPKSSADLEKLEDLLRGFYLTGLHDQALAIIEALMRDASFSGNFDLWPDAVFAIGYQIADERQDGEFRRRVHDKLAEVETYEPSAGKAGGGKGYLQQLMSRDRIAFLEKEIRQNISEGDGEMEQYNRVSLILTAALAKAANLGGDAALTEEMDAVITGQKAGLS